MSVVPRPEPKVYIADALRERYGVARADGVACGESVSDAASLCAAAPASVAVNGDHHVSAMPRFSYAGRDLRELANSCCAQREFGSLFEYS